MTFIEQWRVDLEASLAQFAQLSTRVKDIDFTYGILGAATVWPIRRAVQDYDSDALDAVMTLAGSHGKHILKEIERFGEDPEKAAHILGSQAARNAELRQGLKSLFVYFQAPQTFAQYLAQELAPSQQGETIYNLPEAIQAALVNVGGITNIQTLSVVVNPPYVTPKGQRLKLWLGVGGGIFLLLLTVAFFRGWQSTRIVPMGDGYNVAIAQFTTPDGPELTSEVSDDLSEWLYGALVEEMDRLSPSKRVDTREPAKIGPILGDDAESRRHYASEIAEKHGATILIYGIVTGEEPPYQVQLEYYVNGAGFDYGSEVAGPDYLGSTITFTAPINAHTLATVNARLDGRRRALQNIVTGLGELYYGNYDLAWSNFNLALTIDEWPENEGHEVVHFLMGATRLSAYDPLTRPDELERAEGHFMEARQINPAYARNYLALGVVAYYRAQTIDPAKAQIVAVDNNWLQVAKGHYLTSLSDARQVSSAYINAKANLGLGAINLLGYEFGLEGWSDLEAEVALNQVVADYEANDQSPDLAWLAASAEAQLGLLAYERQDWEMMVEKHQAAIEILQRVSQPPQNWIARYWSRIGLAYSKLKQPDKAYRAYGQAIIIGKDYVAPIELDDWKTQQANFAPN